MCMGKLVNIERCFYVFMHAFCRKMRLSLAYFLHQSPPLLLPCSSYRRHAHECSYATAWHVSGYDAAAVWPAYAVGLCLNVTGWLVSCILEHMCVYIRYYACIFQNHAYYPAYPKSWTWLCPTRNFKCHGVGQRGFLDVFVGDTGWYCTPSYHIMWCATSLWITASYWACQRKTRGFTEAGRGCISGRRSALRHHRIC